MIKALEQLKRHQDLLAEDASWSEEEENTEELYHRVPNNHPSITKEVRIILHRLPPNFQKNVPIPSRNMAKRTGPRVHILTFFFERDTLFIEAIFVLLK